MRQLEAVKEESKKQLIWFETSSKLFVKCCMTGVIAFIHSFIHSWVTLTSFTINCVFFFALHGNCVFTMCCTFFSLTKVIVFCQPDALYEKNGPQLLWYTIMANDYVIFSKPVNSLLFKLEFCIWNACTVWKKHSAHSNNSHKTAITTSQWIVQRQVNRNWSTKCKQVGRSRWYVDSILIPMLLSNATRKKLWHLLWR